MEELTLEEKQYLYGLLEDALFKHKKYLETQGEYPDGETSASGYKLPSQSKLISIFKSIYAKV
tara:strand:- start:2882 stop:3070 length:189 start_codon:yes stop_codon:yes gene_type:complete